MDAPNNRPKFLRHYGRPVELRVKQIGPNLWCGSVYRGAVAIKTSSGTSWIYHWDDLFIALTEESAKHAVMVMAQNLRPMNRSRSGAISQMFLRRVGSECSPTATFPVIQSVRGWKDARAFSPRPP